jgi:hypothetical protein
MPAEVKQSLKEVADYNEGQQGVAQ